ncbi:BRCA1-associated RING domain protein 1 [Caenorhabditis elegans]|uniref:BRCA1-associated RING domain protein 1 n=1 Tax=Caenorhabditis elegans TaxID=6239 RepID=BARD1_CAEEL|nr:BRCA1-associated RING domain protein 1 [Caenorhabditis elegans]Q21209.3 RecName: Full=BRCA1-associated RING domain protein 1; Short=BARD1; Short=Ce-BRD-1; Short=Cebrd-1; AltName: Full=RING-type E3 ubiquitin transferase BARD1 [Caenorhabditis elegans]CCD72622.1 BRCA1-associated RING domain protein 1 [Caenorhabditis elegans]|eukprot:NP_498498.3 BRCA1-associated RING domain protein 1 [Caenorhabditis elegans]
MFENTKKALETFRTAIECVKCKKPRGDLQYLGSSCKHAYCWECIATFQQKPSGKRSSVARHMCPSCAFPLDTSKITEAHMLKTCFDTLSELNDLLQKVGTTSLTQAEFACTQNIFNKEKTPADAVEKFLETQAHMPDEMGQLGEEDDDLMCKDENRENSNSPELDIFHDYSKEASPTRNSTKRPSTVSVHERKPKRSSILKTSVKNEPAAPVVDLFASQVPQRTHQNDLLTPFIERRSTAPAATGVATYAQAFGSSSNPVKAEIIEEDIFSKAIPLTKRQASMSASAKKQPKLEPEEPEEVPSTSRSRKNSIKSDKIERRSQSPMSFGEKSMSVKSEQRRSSYGTRRGEAVLVNSIRNNRIPQLRSAVEAGTCVNEKEDGKTPLYVAVENSSLEAVKILVEAGAVINASCGSTLETTLHEAVRRQNTQIVEYLLSKGASIKIRNIAGKTVEEMAKSDPKIRKIIEKFKTEQRVLQPVVAPPKSRLHFVQLIDEKMLTESEKRKLPGKINIVPADMDSPTHVVVTVDLKTRVLNINKEHIGEILKAIIKSGMIVSRDWLRACIIDPSKVDDDRSYMVQKVRWMEGEVFENTIEQWKKTITKMQPKLFAGCKFFIPKPKYNFLDRPALFEIIRSAGGQAAAREPIIDEKDPPPYHNANLKPNFVLYSLTHDIGDKFRDCTKYNLVSEQWLIEAILGCSITTPPH